MSRAPCGTATSRTSDAYASAKGGEVLETITLDRGCFACMLGGPEQATLFMIAREWHGAENMGSGAGTGQVLTAQVSVPRAGWP